jgi:hypothetical protein
MIFLETRREEIKVRAGVTADMMMGVVNLTHGGKEEANSTNLTELNARDSVTGHSEFRNLTCSFRRAENLNKR